MLQWMTMDPSLSAAHHMSGTANPIYTSVLSDRYYWTKTGQGFPWDIQLYDNNYIYLWVTELDWHNTNTYKVFNSPTLGYFNMPLVPRLAQGGYPGSTIKVSDSSYEIHTDCNTFTTKTLSRMAQVDFTVLTFLDGGSLLTVSSANINKLTDLAGKRVAVIPGTTTEAAVRDMVKKLGLQNVTLLGVKDHAEGVAALDDARIDAYASDRTLLGGLAVSSRNPAKLYLMEDFISYEPYALMVRRGDPAFHLAVDRVLIRLYRSAEVVPIYEKWFGPFPESGSLIAAVYVLNSVPD